MFIKSVLSIVVFSLSSIFLSSFYTNEKEIELDTSKEFLEFLSHFEQTDVPYSIGISDYSPYSINKIKSLKGKKVHQNRAQKYLAKSEFIPGMSKGMFSRMGPPILTPVARFYPKDNVVAVIFKSQALYGAGYIVYKMITYDFKGNILSLIEDSADASFNLGSSDHDSVSSFSIEEGGIITKSNYEKIFKFDVKEKGYNDNEIIEYKLLNNELFQISEKGLVTELSDATYFSKA